MATFVANVQWDINNIDLSVYQNGEVDYGVQNGNFNFNGTNYPGLLFVNAVDGGTSRRLEAYGNISTGFLGVPTGTINAVQELDVNGGTQLWYMQGISIPVSSVVNAALNGDLSQIGTLIQGAFSGNDTIDLSPFNDVMNGYGGIDTVVLTSSFASSSVTLSGSEVVVTTPTDGTDRLSNVEFLNFNGDIRSVASILAPVPVAANNSATEDGAIVNGQLTATDPQGDPVTFALVGSVAGLTIAANGSYSFNPANAAFQSLMQGQVSNVVATFSASDGVYSANSTLTIAVTGVNDAPVFSPASQPLAVDQNTATPFFAFANDVDGDTLAYSSNDPAHGTVTGGAGGSFTYTPDSGYTGSDTITITVTDGNGGSAIKTYNVTVVAVNQPPVFPVESANANVAEDSVLNGNLPVASDPEANPLTYSLFTGAAHGNVVVNANGTYSYTPASDYNGLDSFVAQVSDGLGGTDTVTINTTVTPVNDAPVFPVEAIARVTSQNNGIVGALPAAADIDGDALTYALLAGPANGTATISANGTYSFTPNAGFTGADSFTARVSDGKGGTDTLVVNVAVNQVSAATNDWTLLAATGFAGSIGGSGKVFGAAGFQAITVLDLAGTVVLDASFNKGGDIVRLSGNASDWQVKTVGSTAVFSDGDTFVQVPAGIVGMTVVFDDGVRLLKIDAGAGTLKIGGQAFAGSYTQITAPADGSILPSGADPAASGKILLAPDAHVTAAGKLSIFGTAAGDETVHLLSGNATLDASFNKGGDTLQLDQPASAFLAYEVASSVVLDSASTDVSIPVGTAGMTLEFAGGDARTLLIDTTIDAIVIDNQEIGILAVPLIA